MPFEPHWQWAIVRFWWKPLSWRHVIISSKTVLLEIKTMSSSCIKVLFFLFFLNFINLIKVKMKYEKGKISMPWELSWISSLNCSFYPRNEQNDELIINDSDNMYVKDEIFWCSKREISKWIEFWIFSIFGWFEEPLNESQD